MLMVPYLTFVSYNVDDILGEQSDIEKFWTDGKNLSRETCIMVEKVYNLVNNILRKESIWPWRKRLIRNSNGAIKDMVCHDFSSNQGRYKIA